jgi:hypothetical protein
MSVLSASRRVIELTGFSPEGLDQALLELNYPLVLRGFGKDIPLVKAARESDDKVLSYLESFYANIPVTVCTANAGQKGRIFYNEDMSGFNFLAKRESFPVFIKALIDGKSIKNPSTMYVPSTDVAQWFPGISEENNLGIDALNPVQLLWIGNRTRIAAHYDFPRNLACCIAGRRRFTLFPPEQVANLYPGPLDFSPGGQEISLVDFENPDYERFPRFAKAMEHAQVAELEPGDALLLPGLWWHHVESLDDINILYTHWWRESPAYWGRPANALLHTIMSLRGLSQDQRSAWKHMFDYYVFNRDEHDVDPIPESARHFLSIPLDEQEARKLRAELLNRLKI